jgi:DMSO/TMAO reductase YedYZ molybdopterin-dependent catalytic subunit
LRLDRRLPERPPPVGPFREDAFRSRLHGERTAAMLGIALGVAFTVCFVTGLISHFIQRGPEWTQAAWPAHPVSLYRVTQGIHVLTGMAAIPLLLAKLWVAYPRLWEWPPVRDPLHAIERLGVAALVAGSIFQVVTGLLNVFYWYAFPFPFPSAHYAGAWIAIGGLIMHIGAKWQIARRALTERPTPSGTSAGLSRRGFLAVVGGTSAVILATTLGEVIPGLARVAVLAPRRAGDGPQGVPVNHTAGPTVRDAARSPDYRLEVAGAVLTPLSLSLAELQGMPQSTSVLPISCVEGWSTSATWRGVRVRDLLDRAGAAPDATITVESLEQHGGLRRSVLYDNHARDPLSLLALELNGEPLHIDHGYPLRLIAPNRPGVQQTKWVAHLEVT